MTQTGQTQVVAQGGGGWINQDPIRESRSGKFTHYKNSKGVVTIGKLGDDMYVVACASMGIYSEMFDSREDAEDRVYEILEKES